MCRKILIRASPPSKSVRAVMGNQSTKTDRRIPSVPHFQGETVTFACCCKERKTSVIEEKRKEQSAAVAIAEENLLFLLAYKRTKPRTCCSKIAFGLDYFFMELCPIICCPPLPSAIIHKFAFRPPERPTYDLFQFGRDYRLHLKSAANEFLTLRSRRCQAYTPQIKCFYVHPKHGPKIAGIYAKSFSASPESKSWTLLYSHNNGIDLGLSVGYIVTMARRFRVNVFAYDYAGYGRSGGQCSEDNLYRSVEAAYDFVTKDLGTPADEVIAVGTSLGTAAAIHLASTNRPLRAVILQGGFLSALRYVCPMRSRTCQMDRFVNVDKIEMVKCPTLVVHGKCDKMFSVKHAETLRRLCPGAKKIEPLLIDDCGHIDFDEFPIYWNRIHKFLHLELVNIGNEDLCCTYHPTEIALRQATRIKTSKKLKR